MGLETGSTIASFITSNPTSSDPVNQGDYHLRLIKSVLQAQFPGVGGLGYAAAITTTEAELNSLHTGNITTILPAVSGYVIGANSPILVTDTLLGALGKAQGQIDARSAITGNEIVTNVQSVNGLKVSSGVIDTVGYLTLSQSYTIQTLGTTSNTQWNTIAGTTNVTAGSFVPGRTYVIVSPGTTDFTLIGAANSTIGTSFIATGVGSGSGTALQTYLVGSTFTCANIGTSLGNGTAFRVTNTTAQLVTSGAFIVTATYIIQSIGTTDFTLIGAASNTIGLSFVASGVGTGTGKAYRVNSLGLSGSVVLPVASTIVSPTISGAVMSTMASSILTSRTVQSASGTALTFSSIPSWVKRITVMLSGVSTTSTGVPAIKLGTSGGIVSSGYTSVTSAIAATSAGSSASATSGFELINNGAGTNVYHGVYYITNITGNNWVITGQTTYGATPSTTAFATGSVALSGVLTQVQLTTTGGTDTFDAGTINIMYE
jgi:hypothetical protein